jgi:hypothetical protein
MRPNINKPPEERADTCRYNKGPEPEYQIDKKHEDLHIQCDYLLRRFNYIGLDFSVLKGIPQAPFNAD